MDEYKYTILPTTYQHGTHTWIMYIHSFRVQRWNQTKENRDAYEARSHFFVEFCKQICLQGLSFHLLVKLSKSDRNLGNPWFWVSGGPLLVIGLLLSLHMRCLGPPTLPELTLSSVHGPLIRSTHGTTQRCAGTISLNFLGFTGTRPPQWYKTSAWTVTVERKAMEILAPVLQNSR